MKIVVLDGYTENPGDISWEPLEALGEVTVYDRTSYEESPLSTRPRSAKRLLTNARISRQSQFWQLVTM